MINKLIFWLTVPIKVLGIKAVIAGRALFDKKIYTLKRFPDLALKNMVTKEYMEKLYFDLNEVGEILRSKYHFLNEETAFHLPRLQEVKNPSKDDLFADHQALRTGSAIWANYDQELMNGLEYFFDKEGKFSRGIKRFGKNGPELTDQKCVPAMPMSIAFGMIRAYEHDSDLYIKDGLAQKFTYAVNELMKNDFEMGDLSVKPRAIATAYDAVFACSLLGVAHLVTKNEIYSNEMERIWKQYRFLLMEPYTYFKNRNYFLDHIIMFGLWTCVKGSVSVKMRDSFKYAMRKVYAQSAHFGNPYFAALCDECDCLDKKDRRMVLKAHYNVSFITASRIEDVKQTDEIPVDWSQMSDIEFTGDQIPINGQPYRLPTKASEQLGPQVPLSGAVLARSIMILVKSERLQPV